MIGQAPDSEVFKEMFPWSNAVIPVRPDGSDVVKVLAQLKANPELVSAISQTNAVEALLRHDWVYRWKKLFKVAGVAPSADMAARECRLKDLAGFAAPNFVNVAPWRNLL